MDILIYIQISSPCVLVYRTYDKMHKR